MNEIKYITLDGDEYIVRFDDIVKIDTLPSSMTVERVGGYVVNFTAGNKSDYWTVGGPGSYVDYRGIRYNGEEIERLRAVLEREKIEKMLWRM